MSGVWPPLLLQTPRAYPRHRAGGGAGERSEGVDTWTRQVTGDAPGQDIARGLGQEKGGAAAAPSVTMQT